jgi:hypothetical protein
MIEHYVCVCTTSFRPDSDTGLPSNLKSRHIIITQLAQNYPRGQMTIT